MTITTLPLLSFLTSATKPSLRNISNEQYNPPLKSGNSSSLLLQTKRRNQTLSYSIKRLKTSSANSQKKTRMKVNFESRSSSKKTYFSTY